MAERTIVLDGFSKTYAMTGWRLGYAIVPESLVFAFGRLIINSVTLRRDVRPGRRGRGPDRPAGRGRRDGRRVPRPARPHRRRPQRDPGHPLPATAAGAFYVFPDVSGTGRTGAELADRLLHEAGVSVLAGTAFGERRQRTTSG